MMRASSGTSVSTVGSKKLPWLPMRLPPVCDLGALLVRIDDELSMASTRRGLASGPILLVGSRPSPTFSVLGQSVNFDDKAVIDLLVHEEARRRYAHLPGIAVLHGGHELRHPVAIDIVEHEHRGVAAKLHGRALHVLAGKRVEVLADRHRARERDLADRSGCGIRYSEISAGTP